MKRYKLLLMLVLVLFTNLFTENILLAQEVVVDSTAIINYDSEDVVEPAEENAEPIVANFTSIDSINYSATQPTNNFADTINRIKKDDAYWYVNGYTKEETATTKEKGFWYYFFKILYSKTLKVIAWVVFIALLVLLVYFILKDSGVLFFGKKNKAVVVHQTNVEEVEENLLQTNFQALIQQSIQHENYRLATRYLFLQSLVLLHNKQLIQYQPEKTNFSYVMGLTGTKYVNSFASCVKTYEYIWYGEFLLTQQQFEQVNNQFIEFQQLVIVP